MYDVVEGWELFMSPGVAMDPYDQVYVFCMGIKLFMRARGVLDLWGDGIFTTRAQGGMIAS